MRAAALALTCAALLYAAFATSYSALGTPLHRDEHQFMASAALVARQGMQPYRDFAYFHMPNLVYAYQPLFLSSRPFLLARLTSAACAFAICLLVFFAIRSYFQHFSSITGALTAAAAVILLCNSNIFQFTAGKIWNQSSALLCALVALLVLFRAAREPRLRWFVLCGLSLGLAVGLRLSFAPLVLPFLFVAVFYRAPTWPEKFRRFCAFSAGGLVSNLPTLYFCLTSPDGFFFGQFGYPSWLNRLYLLEASRAHELSYSGKLWTMLKTLCADPASAAITLVAISGLGLLAWESWRHRRKLGFRVAFLVAAVPFVILGSVAPSPAYEQYFFQLLPFLLLLGLISIAQLSPRLSRAGQVFLLISAAASFFYAGGFKKHIADLSVVWNPRRWTPMRVADRSEHLQRLLSPSGSGQCLTLSPIYPIEAGLPIVPEFATGPFAWRVSHFVSREEAARRKMPWAPGLAEFLQARRPLAVMTGQDRPNLETPIVETLVAEGFSPTTVSKGFVVWQPPPAAAE